MLTDAVLAAALASAAAHGCMVVADPKRPDFAAYRGATVLTPNEHEVRLATRIGAEHDTEADRAGRAALDATGGEAVVVTRSAKGLTLVRRNSPALHLPTRAREVADVSGAGDTLPPSTGNEGCNVPADSLFASVVGCRISHSCFCELTSWRAAYVTVAARRAATASLAARVA